MTFVNLYNCMLIIVRKAGGHLGGVGICGVIAVGYWWKRMEYGPVGREETAQVYLSKGDSSPEFDTNEKQINSRTLRQTTSVLKRRVGEGSAGR